MNLSLHEIVDLVIAFVKAHDTWIMPIVFLLAFGESLAFFSLLLPATIILLGLGALIGESGLNFWPIWLAAAVGAFLGDWVSYIVGAYFKGDVGKIWPISRKPQLLTRVHRFFERWGIWSIFFGRFFGPFRAIVPLVAGICAMPLRYFQIANICSALIWSFGVLAPGAFGLQWLVQWVS
ncbi:DedA family protein [Photorhabdus luminescens]|uniref:DedA family protein n=1 Tax=Photorhabdus luminescens TaxID=29488 RepID=UPI003D2A92EA